MKPKMLVTIALLTFVVVSVFALIAKEVSSDSDSQASSQEATKSVVTTVADGVTVYYFHGETRCATCRAIEAYTQEAIETAFAEEMQAGTLEFKVVNVDTPSEEHFIEDYQLVSSTVVLVRSAGHTQQDWKNLDEVWELVHDKDSFMTYIQDETTAMLQGAS